MIAMLARRIALTLFLALVVMAFLERFNPAPPPLIADLRRADFPVCVTVHNGPLEHPRGVILNPDRSAQA